MTTRDPGGSGRVQHEPCPDCGSRDNLARYSDGHGFCFTEGCARYEPPTDGSSPASPRKKRTNVNFIHGDVREIPSRKLRQDTAEKFNYQQGIMSGKGVQIAPYHDADGQLVAQKIRTKDKEFFWLGDPDDALPFGANRFPKTGKQLVITEGEIDAMAMSQAQENKWPVVSIASGAGSQTRKYIANQLEYFDGFDKIVIMFDMDEPGRKAAKQAAEIIGPRSHIAELPLKDPGEMLKQGRVKDLVNAMWRAKKYSPEGLVDLADLKASIKERPKRGLSWCLPTLTDLTYGKRRGELIAIGAGTGIGKTDLLTQDMKHMIEVHQLPIGVFALEQNPKETGLRLVGKLAERPLHIPDYWDEGLFDETWEKHIREGQIHLYDSFGVNTWDAVKTRIKYLATAHDVKDFYLDHITAIAASVDKDERKALDNIMSELGSLVKELDVTIIFVSHLATPDGKPHEEGGRVAIRHFRGSRAIGFWAHYMVGMERDQQANDPDTRATTTVRMLKDRYTGRATGQTFHLGYDHETGILYERDAPEEAKEYGFDVETDLDKDPPMEGEDTATF